MLTGLWDHWTPSAMAISSFWQTPFPLLKPELDRILDKIDINNFTFYSKWYSNGIKSSLPFLSNHPNSMNVKTNNDWGRELIKYFHARNITVTLVLQCYTFEKELLPGTAILGEWPGLSNAIGYERPVAITNPAWKGYPEMLKLMVSEQLQCFPEIDGFFFEFEGLSAVLSNQLELSPFTLISDTFSESVLKQWQTSGTEPNRNSRWLWTENNQQILAECLHSQLHLIENIFKGKSYRGLRGLVFHALGYEVPYIENVLPNRDWWLLPWHYWGWDFAGGDNDETTAKQLNFCQQRFRHYRKNGYKLCYIGNATLPTNRPDTIAEMIKFSRDINANGYIGMGNPIKDYGLRWHHATEESVRMAEEIYQKLFPKFRYPYQKFRTPDLLKAVVIKKTEPKITQICKTENVLPSKNII